MNFQVCIVLALCACAFADQEVDKKTDKRNIFGLGYGYNGLHAPVVAPALHAPLPYHAPQHYAAPHHYSPAQHAPYVSSLDHGFAPHHPVAASPYDLGYSGLGYPADLGYSGGLGYSSGLGYSAGLGYSDYGY